MDRDEERLASLEAGWVPFYEPGLEELVRKNADKAALLDRPRFGG